MPYLVNTERNQSKHGFSLMIAFYILFFGHCDTYWHANNFAGQFQILETDIPLRSETTRYFHKLNWSSLYALLVFKLRHDETCPFLTQNPNAVLILVLRFLFLNDVNVRESNVMKPSLKELVLIRSYYNFSS